MVLTRFSDRSKPLFSLAGLLLVATLLGAALWWLAGMASRAQAGLDARALEPVAGTYRDAKVTLWLRYAEPHLWARTGDSRWERLAPTGTTTLRGAALGYEIDLARALRPTGLPRVSISAGGETRELTLVVLPIVNGRSTDAYLRGTMNDWSSALAFTSVAVGTYVAETPLARGKHEFKVGSADWYTIDLGGDGDAAPITLGQTLQLFPVGSNIHVAVQEAGTYRFVLDLRNPRRPTVTVSRVR